MTTDPTATAGRAELRRRFVHTTPGPWRIGWFDGPGRILIEAGPEDDPTWINQDPSAEDAELIVQAVNALPKLLDALDQAEAKLSRAEAAWRIAEQNRSHAQLQSDRADRAGRRFETAEAALARVREVVDSPYWGTYWGEVMIPQPRLRAALDGE